MIRLHLECGTVAIFDDIFDLFDFILERLGH